VKGILSADDQDKLHLEKYLDKMMFFRMESALAENKIK
jgi:hypothetical protein